MSWVISTVVSPSSAEISAVISSRLIRVWASTEAKGSSMRSTRGWVGQRAGDRDALLHAAGELPGVLVLDAGEVHPRERLGGPLVRSCRGSPCSPNSTFLRTLSHGKRLRLYSWKTIPKPSGTLRTAWSSKVTSPRLGLSRPAMVRSRVVLPQPDGPTMATNSPSAHGERHRADRLDAGALLADVGLADPVGGGAASGLVEVVHEVRPFIPSNQNMARFSMAEKSAVSRSPMSARMTTPAYMEVSA